MRTVALGSDGPQISRLGIGSWQAGGSGPWGAGGDADDDDAVAAIRFAVESGVTWVDTAPGYGLGHAEEVVARALSPWRIGNEVLVFTKCGHPWDPPDHIRTDLRPESIRRECEGSLARLGVDRLDLLQIHHPDPATPVEDSWGTLADLAEEGKVRWIGVSNFGPDLLQRCDTVRHVDTAQPELNLLKSEARDDVIPWCSTHGTAVLVYSPQAGGILTGRDAAYLEAASRERRAGAPAEAISELVYQLVPIAQRHGVTVGALAVSWTLSVEGVAAAICGGRRPAQVKGWIGAPEIGLDSAEIAEIEAVIRRVGIARGEHERTAHPL
jgi:aryl-alcohol dehydrogenase-like predicted oxidoreductase